MLPRRKSKGGLGTLLLAGAAAYAYYRYTKMSADQKRDLTDNLKRQGNKIVDQFRGVGTELKDTWQKQTNKASRFSESNAGSRFGEGSDYTS